MKKFVPNTLIVIEGALTAVPFLISWWISAIYRSILSGWAVSGMTGAEKKSALSELLGGG